MERVKNIPFNLWPSMAVALTDDLRWLVLHHERAVRNRRPSGRPIKMWPNGRVRIEFFGTFQNAAAARAAAEKIVNAETMT